MRDSVDDVAAGVGQLNDNTEKVVENTKAIEDSLTNMEQYGHASTDALNDIRDKLVGGGTFKPGTGNAPGCLICGDGFIEVQEDITAIKGEIELAMSKPVINPGEATFNAGVFEEYSFTLSQGGRDIKVQSHFNLLNDHAAIIRAAVIFLAYTIAAMVVMSGARGSK